ncbi:MAG: NAD(P)/FAD-dependent oxidoreductase [Frankia sp.]|nr:NAD(P)/FAD-dependent oxidoreductase [Frankia sp.]
MAAAPEHLDIAIIGAGISGIGIAHHLTRAFPGRSLALLEARDTLGGTWDLFRYPGIRSDSDMHTLGFSFRPWTGEKSIADGGSILRYLVETAQADGTDRRIRYGHQVVAATWSSAEARWTLDVDVRTDQGGDGGAAGTRRARLTCTVLIACTGYYDYDQGYCPEFPGIERFRGRVVHPQHWPADLAVAGARVVVIGSGATAMTLVPALARQGAQVTMLQRSPTYVIELPSVDPFARWARRRLPAPAASRLIRWQSIARTDLSYRLSRRLPRQASETLIRAAARRLPEGYDVARHFTPRYRPWDQRVCVLADGDLFEEIRAGRATVATGHIETFTEHGIRLRSGEELPADVVATATGLRLRLLGGLTLTVDGEPVTPASRRVYKSVLLEDVPNFAFVFGYTNASWTLKVDLAGRYLSRLLRHLDRRGCQVFVPHALARPGERGVDEQASILGLTSGYITRARDELPRQGTRRPWRMRSDYLADLRTLRFGPVRDRELLLRPAPPPTQRTPAEPAASVPAPADRAPAA